MRTNIEIDDKLKGDGLTLLHADRDFDPFVLHLGLRVAYSEI
jgi:hypothetical protein